MEAGFVADGNIHIPLGARNGGPASRSDQFRLTVKGELERLDQCSQVWIEDGEVLVSIACGGGGYGNPYERDPELVLEDVLEKYVSLEAAKRDYGVVITSDMKVNIKATEKLRTQCKAKTKREQLFVDQATPPYAATPFRQIQLAELPKPIRQHIIKTLKEVGHTVTDEK